jgi:hypothetical protein
MENIVNFIIFAVGFFVVFGGISYLWNRIEDHLSGETEMIVRKTGKKINLSEGADLVEYADVSNPERTVYRKIEK